MEDLKTPKLKGIKSLATTYKTLGVTLYLYALTDTVLLV